MDIPPPSTHKSDPVVSTASAWVYVWPAARYAVAALGIAALGLWLRSWVFAPLAALALVQSVRIGLTARRALPDHRDFGQFADESERLLATANYRDLLAQAKAVAAGSLTTEFRAWGVEWASYAAVMVDDQGEIADLLAVARSLPVPPHVPAQLYAALGDYGSAVPFFEAALVERRDEEAVIAFVHALAASGDTERAGQVIESAYEAEPTTGRAEWQIWSNLEAGLVDEAFGLSESLAGAEVSVWGMSVCQVAAMRAGDHERSLVWGERALAAEPHPSIRSVTAYNRACSFAQMGQLDRALEELERVADTTLMEGAPDDEDLEPLWDLDTFARIVAAGR